MAHTYAHVGEFNDYLRDTGSTTFAAESALIIARKLGTLEAASRRVDEWCQRSMFGSGFGPRIGTNRYDGSAGSCVRLEDDLLSLTSVTLLDASEGTSLGSVAANTDYYLRDGAGHYDRAPYREFVLHGQGAITVVGTGERVSSFVGKWGYEDTRVTLTTLAAAITTTTATTITLTAAAVAGMTLYIDTEQLYVTTGGTSATVVRGANGTTASTHSNGATVERFTYDSAVTDTTLRIALRRWKARDAGADGTDGGGDLPVTSIREGEDLILKRGVWHLAYRWAV